MPWRHLVVMVVVVATAVPASAADGTADGVVNGQASNDPRLVQAIADYRALKLERAMTAVDTFLFDGSISSTERAQALLLHGLCSAQLGEPVAARTTFVQAYAQDPDVVLAVPIPKKVQSLMDSARAEVLARPPATTTTTDTTTTNATTTTTGPSPTFISGAIVVGVGGAALIGAGVAGVIGASLASSSDDPAATQREAVERADAANTALVVAAISGVAGAAAVAVGVGLVSFAE
jgi:hypothetical protein